MSEWGDCRVKTVSENFVLCPFSSDSSSLVNLHSYSIVPPLPLQADANLWVTIEVVFSTLTSDLLSLSFSFSPTTTEQCWISFSLICFSLSLSLFLCLRSLFLPVYLFESSNFFCLFSNSISCCGLFVPRLFFSYQSCLQISI